MAIEIEDLQQREATVHRFPTAAVRARVRRDRMLARRRRAAAAAALVLLGTAVATGGSSVASRPGAPAAVTLQAGETLWEVARRHAPDGADLRAYVDALVEENGLRGVPQAGRRLRLPR